MSQLKTPTYGIRELSLRGAPLSREDWLARNQGHDLRVVELQDIAVTIVDEEVEVDEEVPVLDPRSGAQTGVKKTGKKVWKKTGKKVERRSEAKTNVTLYFDLTTGVLAIDNEPLPAKEA